GLVRLYPPARLISQRNRNHAARKLVAPVRTVFSLLLSSCSLALRRRAVALPVAAARLAFAASRFHKATQQRACLIGERNSFLLPSSISWHREYSALGAKWPRSRNGQQAYRATTQISPESNRPWCRSLLANRSAK